MHKRRTSSHRFAFSGQSSPPDVMKILGDNKPAVFLGLLVVILAIALACRTCHCKDTFTKRGGSPCGAACQARIATSVTKGIVASPNACFGKENFSAKDLYHSAKAEEKQARFDQKSQKKIEAYKRKETHNKRVQAAKDKVHLAKKVGKSK